MAQTLTRLLVHVVFSTKHRHDLIHPEIEPELYAYIGAICRNQGSPLLTIGGTQNHLHLLVSLSKTVPLAALLMDVKRDSSRWIKSKGEAFAGFAWQEGYGGFTIGESQAPALTRYIGSQKEKHASMTFEEEFLAFLRKYRVPYDPDHIWD